MPFYSEQLPIEQYVFFFFKIHRHSGNVCQHNNLELCCINHHLFQFCRRKRSSPGICVVVFFYSFFYSDSVWCLQNIGVTSPRTDINFYSFLLSLKHLLITMYRRLHFLMCCRVREKQLF